MVSGILGTKHTSQLQQPVSLTGFTPEAATTMGMDLCAWTWVPTEFGKHPVTFPAKPQTHLTQKNDLPKVGEKISSATQY